MCTTFYAKNISFSHKATSWNNFNFEVKQGESVSLIGSSGIGKTTLMRVLAGLHEYKNGNIYIDYENNKVEQPLSPVFIVFQDYNLTLLPWLTIKENINLGLHKSKKKNQTSPDLNSILSMLFPDTTNHNSTLQKYPDQLSGGQKQRVQIARALIADSDFIFFDEPDTGFDYKNKLSLREVLKKLITVESKGVVLTTHDLENAFEVSNRYYIIHNNKEKNDNICLTELNKKDFSNLQAFRKKVLEYI